MDALKELCIVVGIFIVLNLIGQFVPPNRNHGVLQVGDLRCSLSLFGYGYVCEDTRR
jgi:hypothetical protein